MYRVRQAEFFDVNQIVNMQRLHREEVKSFSALEFNVNLAELAMAKEVNSDTNLILVVHKEGEPVLLGYIWSSAIKLHYTNSWYLSEIYTYVAPFARGGKALHLLLQESKKIAIDKGAKYFNIGSFSGNNKLTKAYSKRYEEVGRVFNINLEE